MSNDKIYISLIIVSFDSDVINQHFNGAKKRKRVASKDQLVIESAAPYCSKLTSLKLRNATMFTGEAKPSLKKISCLTIHNLNKNLMWVIRGRNVSKFKINIVFAGVTRAMV